MNQDSVVVSVTGLGYVGLPVAVAMAKAFKTIGFDINSKRVNELKDGVDHTGEVETHDLKKSSLQVTDQVENLRTANFHIIAVPTPVNSSNQPDLSPLLGATRTIAKVLKKGDIVVYESTVYPGLTEEECIPVLEEISGLKVGVDFKVGYSPERINPGDKLHTLEKIKKVVSAQDAESLETVAFVYGSVITAGVYKATSIKVAEAAKVIENTQRDLNIALMNELAIIFDRMGIDTQEVLEAAATKWNFMKFTPGLVGGHCIGVDPYYLTHKAEKLGYQPQVILAGRRINDGMGKFIAMRAVKEMVRAGHAIHNARVTVLGLTFKENCPDLRNSKVINIIDELRDFGLQVQIHDPLADRMEALEEYGVELTSFENLLPASAVIVAVAHEDYKKFTPEQLKKMMGNKPVVIDVKGVYSQTALRENDIQFWRL
jgi:UDP-N-acetyl-D-glucosamine/UDP-N-acetyl-D-galactosamine dehydrogenase